jgi:hypothetical protein
MCSVQLMNNDEDRDDQVDASKVHDQFIITSIEN